MTLAACTVALLLLVDISGSVDTDEYELQKNGIIQALKSPEISSIIEKSEGVAVSVVEWGLIQKTTVSWNILKDKNSIEKFTKEYRDSERDSGINFKIDTNISGALEYGITEFDRVPCEPIYKIIDISGDGPNTSGVSTKSMIEKAEYLSITINGLPILTELYPKLDEYYRENVVTNDGFVIPAEGFEDFGKAIRSKLLKEIAEGIKNGKI